MGGPRFVPISRGETTPRLLHVENLQWKDGERAEARRKARE